jgi:MFS family permease
LRGQGVITPTLGIGSSYIVANLSWRWLYFILAILTAASWLMLVAFVSETRWQRTSEEMRELFHAELNRKNLC